MFKIFKNLFVTQQFQMNASDTKKTYTVATTAFPGKIPTDIKNI